MYTIILVKIATARPLPPASNMSYDAAYNWVMSQSSGNQMYYNIIPV